MRRTKPVFVFLIPLLALSPAFAGFPAAYIQPPSAAIYQGPQESSAKVSQLARGTAVEVLIQKGAWSQVKLPGGKTGWTLKTVLGPEKPMTTAELNRASARPEKASRFRLSTRAATMGVRGLTNSMRVREGRDEFRADYDAVDKLDKQAPDKRKLEEFRKAGELAQ